MRETGDTGDGCERVLGGKYRLGPLISSGGMGRVHRATHLHLGTEVAIKLLVGDAGTSADERSARFLREARAAARLRHPNVVGVLDFGVDGGEPYLVMELLAGETLAALLEREGALSAEQTCRIVRGIGAALDFAHAAGVVHRDLKPHNVFLAGRPGGTEVVVLDFGLAKMLEPAADPALVSTASGSMLGTPAYMSPEQAGGTGAIGPRSDLWALGVIAYECLVGRRPFEAESLGEMVLQICAWPLPVPSQHAALSLAVDRWFARACHREEAERFASGCALAGALEDALGAEPAIIAPRRRRSRVWAPAALAGLVGLAVAVAVVRDPDAPAAKPAHARRIAVLPLDGATDPEGAMLADGATEELIAGLSRRSGVPVIASASVMRFRQPSGRDLRAVARDLGVDRLVVGTLRQEGKRARIALELVDARDLTVTWARSFNRPADELEALYGEAAAELAAHLGGTVHSPPPARDPAAYRAYLRGRYFWNKRDHAGLLRAIEAFQEALRIDPDHARAWIGLADSYVLLPWMGPTPEREANQQARAALARALTLDPASSEAHTTRGNLLVEIDWQFAEAERAFRRAIELDPDNATAHQWLGELLVLFRRFDEAVAEMDRALEIDPLNAAAHKQRATVLYHAGRYREALAAAETALELDPAQPYGLGWKGYALIELGRSEEGLAAIRADPISQLAGMEPMLLVQETYAAWRRGDRATVERLWPRIEAAGMINIQPFMMAFAYAMAGRPDDMFAALEAAVAARAKMTPYIATGHQFDPYRSDPRFVSLMHRLGL